MTFLEAERWLLSLHSLARSEYLVDRRNPRYFLQRLQRFLNILGNPERRIPHYIHVAGTSGKGSTCLMLESIWRAGGKKTGLFTSPALNGPRSSFMVQGKIMSQADFVSEVKKIQRALTNYLKTYPLDPPSYFEILTALGLSYFAARRVAWAVLEVGLGGKYDSTNIIPYKDAAVITNIGLDHTAVLGKTTAKIAVQKAGIIISKAPVFSAERDPRIQQIIRRTALQHGAPFTLVAPAEKKSDANSSASQKLLAPGIHQHTNARLARAVAAACGIPEPAIRRGLKRVHLPLRCEIVSRRPLIIIDGAHNPDKIHATTETVKMMRSRPGKIYIIFGCAEDKTIGPMLTELSTLQPHSFVCTRFTAEHHRRSANPDTVYAFAKKKLGTRRVELYLDPSAALDSLLPKLGPSDTLLITGSLFLASELKNAWQRRRFRNG